MRRLMELGAPFLAYLPDERGLALTQSHDNGNKKKPPHNILTPITP